MTGGKEVSENSPGSLSQHLMTDYMEFDLLNMKEDKDGEILSKYGPRTFSRIKGMCDLVIVEGNDLRNI